MTFFSLLDSVRCFECGETVPIPNLEEHMSASHGYVKCQKCDQLFIPYRFDDTSEDIIKLMKPLSILNLPA